MALIAGLQGATRLLWADEIITASIARQGSFGAIWSALALGADPNPPLTHLLVLGATRLFGWSALAVRIPSILLMLLAIACMWCILRRWVAPLWAVVGVLAFTATRGFDYAYEARSYAPLTGFTMAALLCWIKMSSSSAEDESTGAEPGSPPQHPAIPRARLIWPALLALSLALAVSSNYYGVLAWFPIAAGEAVVTSQTRRLRPAVWLAMLAGALPLFWYLPLIRHNIAEFTPHAWNRTNLAVVPESYFILVEGVFWPVAAAALWLAWTALSVKKTPVPPPLRIPKLNSASLRLPAAHEFTAVAVLLLYPVLGLALSAAGGGMISPRCVLPVCCGFGIAAALLGARLLPSPRQTVAVVLVALTWSVARQAACFVLLHQQRTNFEALLHSIESQISNNPGPVLIADSNLALPLGWYASPSLRARLDFPIDFAAIHQYEADDSGEQNLWAGRSGIFPLRVVPYTAALAPGFDPDRPALVLSRPTGWLPHLLARDGLVLRDATTPQQQRALLGLGGVFTPMAHDGTRLLEP